MLVPAPLPEPLPPLVLPPGVLLEPPDELPEPLDELPEPLEFPLLPEPVDVPLVPAGRLDPLPVVPIPELAPPQLADSIRTDVTRTRWVFVSAEAVDDDDDEVVEEEEDDRRAFRDAVRAGGMIVPITSTCCPSWPCSADPCSSYVLLLLPVVPAVPLMLPAFDELEPPPTDPLAPLEDIAALLSVYVGVEKELRDVELRDVDDELRAPAPVVPVEDGDVVDPLVPVVDPLVPMEEL